MFLFLFVTAFLLGSLPVAPLLAAGKTYEGSEQGRHCALWSTDRLRWPQTSVGREKQECRRRAVRPTAGVIQCRLRRSYIDEETGEMDVETYIREANGVIDYQTEWNEP